MNEETEASSINQEETSSATITNPTDTELQVEKCPVCLQKFQSSNSKSYTSKCFHSFCFECILEWSKVRYNCPLCKAEFKRIIYDLISRLEFKEYILKPREVENNTLDIISISPDKPGPFRAPTVVSRASWLVNAEQAPLEFRMLIYNNKWYANPYLIQIDVKTTNIELESVENSSQNTQENILTDNLACLSYKPVRCFRNTSPEWFKKNPAGTHRLLKFLYRELKALTAIVPSSSADRLNHSMRSNLMHEILELIKKIDINSEEFYEKISQYLRPLKYGKHFQHELNAFAKSTITDLIDYDSKCVYYNDLEQMPKTNESLAENPKIIPFNCLPVNLSKYRLLHRENTIDSYYEDFEASQTVAPSTSYQSDSRENFSDSEYSSYCEEVSPPRKNTPPLLVISSDSDNEASTQIESPQTSSKRKSEGSDKERKRHKSKKHKHRRSSRSKKKSKKSKKKKHKSRKYSSSSSRSRSRTRSRERRRSLSQSS